MKYHLILVFSVSIFSLSCKEAEQLEAVHAPTDPAAHLKAAYELCSRYDDVAAAAPLAYQLAAVEPAEATKWKEELAKIHFATQRHASCLKILEDLTSQHGLAEKLPLLEMMALCHEGLGQRPEATSAWKGVWEKSGSALHAVRLAGLQFETDAHDETQATITAGLAAADAKTANLPLPKTREEMQQIPAAAALHNLKALHLLKQDPSATEEARAELEAALALAPEFEIAKRNLDGLTKPMEASPEAVETITPLPGES